ncbi:unnamed protein product [Cylicocyclus nassatus]|uniref:Uncharacterized protein n=1 Tax=Cylicocyclus nassatus TaxID=53992 RepID=A0AA36M0W7_CYLNA|nr:unnamed protein product [Cylicocyclus nassatus]
MCCAHSHSLWITKPMRVLLILISLFITVSTLECHVGWSILPGSNIGEETKTCGKNSDYCYNATAQIYVFANFQKAGCNTLICQYVMDRCVEYTLLGIPMRMCCCKNENYCNRGPMLGFQGVQATTYPVTYKDEDLPPVTETL